MPGSLNEHTPVTTVVTWRIRQGREKEFEAWRQEISAAALEFPGHMGINVIKSSGTEPEYVVIFRFDTYQNLCNWMNSDVRKGLLKKAGAFSRSEPSYQQKDGLEFWFVPAEGSSSAPPQWKMAVVTALGVWPVSMLVPQVLMPLIAGYPAALQALVIAIGIVIVLTWIVMPILVKILKPWLHHGSQGR